MGEIPAGICGTAPQAVAIGASAGGFDAIRRILTPLPSSIAWPILVVLHRGATSDDILPSLLARDCHLTVKEAEDKEALQPGLVYLAPSNYHMLVELDHTLSLTVDDRVSRSRPSIDVLFETAADAFGERLIGVLLTGANSDGTAGLARIKARGGLTLAQRPTDAQVPTMPLSAIRSRVVDHVLSLEDIARLLLIQDAGTQCPERGGIPT